MRRHSFPVHGQALPVYFCETAADLQVFAEWVANQRDAVAVDSESQGLAIYNTGPTYLRMVQFGTPEVAYCIPTEFGAAFRTAARDALERLPHLVLHNAAFDSLVFDEHLGFPLEKLWAKTTDTMILCKLRDPRGPQDGGIGAGLKQNAEIFVDPTAPDTQKGLKEEFRKRGLTLETGWAGIPIDNPVYVSYGGGDVILTARLLPIMKEELKRVGGRQALVDYEHQISRIAATMSRSGMRVDAEYTRELSTRLAEETEVYARRAAEFGVTNINATAQVVAALESMGEVWADRTDSGNPKVDKAVLLRFADMDAKWKPLGTRTPNPLAEAIIHAKRASKWNSAYAQTMLTKMDGNGYIHPSLNTLQARTGRMSITGDLAAQTLPSSDWMIRRCLLADPGHVFVSCDFEAVEMRVLAALADVKRMKTAIQRGEDLHGFTARLVFGDDYTPDHRKLCKGVGFGKVYGGGAATIARQTGAPIEDVQRAIAAYDKVYPEIKRAGTRWQREARSTGMVHVSVTGRILPLDRDRTYAVTNYACQSAARDVLGQSLIHMDDAGLLPYLKLPIHDEVLASVPRGEAPELAREIERCMNYDLYDVPISAKADIGGPSWGHSYMPDDARRADPLGF